jgi:SecD/SecF fusion protein
MTKKNIYILVSILVLFAVALWMVLPVDGDRFGRKGFLLGLDLKGGSHLVYEADLTKKDPSQTDEQVMAGVTQKIERRANAYGVTEPIIQREGTNRIIVQLPGIKNIDEAVNLIGQVALLEFKETISDASGQPQRNEAGDNIWKTATAIGSDGKEKELTGKYLKPNSKVTLQKNTNIPEVAFEWNDEGAVLFEQITKRNLQKPLGIFLDNQLISAPTVQAVIKSSGVITGPELKEAQDLSIQLNSGSLDVPLTIVQRMDVDATLGADSLKKSLYAGFVGLVLVALFMLIYYRLPGLLAVCALLVYGSVSLAIFKMIPVTLTLPAIAGFIISIGMAVDANILVFERMKEELRAGRTLGAAVEEGFRRAWPSIRDSNISTFITCLILYWFGGTFGAFMVQGFAITLFLGVVVSMFSALIVTRTFLRVLVGSRVVTSLSAYGVSLHDSLPPPPGTSVAPAKKAWILDFVGNKRWFFLASAVIIIPGMISLGIFHLKPGIDFSSGTAMTIHMSEEVDQARFRQAFSDLGYGEAIIQHTGTGDYLVRIPSITPEQKTALTDGLAKSTGKEVAVRDFYAVSPLIAGETAGNALIAVAAAAIGILLYISFAFRKMFNPFRWGTCAVVALIHDVLLVLGVFSILGWALGVEVDAMFITAMLTVVGYSVHDTIVVFDRIRENMMKGGHREFESAVNSGIVETLVRSLNTSLTVILVVFALLLLGGATIHYFILALLIGIITGTYSSIGNASQLLVVWEKGK